MQMKLPRDACTQAGAECLSSRKQSFSSAYLRRHPIWRPNEALPLAQRGRDLRGHAEVCELDFPFVRQQNVGTLNVSMHLAHGVQIRESLKSLPTHEGDLLFSQRSSD